MQSEASVRDWARLAGDIKSWGRALGFDAVGITGTELAEAERRLLEWLALGRHGDMDYMARHGTLRSRPGELLPGALRVISARMNYLARNARDSESVLADGGLAFVSRYALGRDYHKLLRTRLQKLARRIGGEVGPFGYRVLVDSAPAMEVELARRAGLGWRGKHTLLLHREAGSYFFLGELYTDLPLPADGEQRDHCGDCERCIAACPTGAIVAPYQIDARRCISYLTIELPGAIPEDLRPLLGNRIYGCDDCQLACPWNRFARVSEEADFEVRNGLDAATLTELFAWSAEEFNRRFEGSAIRRIGHERWLRNIAVALGNAPSSPEVVRALRARADHASSLVREHVAWALARHCAA
jgi:epoxyqueuosine reductase